MGGGPLQEVAEEDDSIQGNSTLFDISVPKAVRFSTWTAQPKAYTSAKNTCINSSVPNNF